MSMIVARATMAEPAFLPCRFGQSALLELLPVLAGRDPGHDTEGADEGATVAIADRFGDALDRRLGRLDPATIVIFMGAIAYQTPVECHR
jgi:hypothetical protein